MEKLCEIIYIADDFYNDEDNIYILKFDTHYYLHFQENLFIQVKHSFEPVDKKQHTRLYSLYKDKIKNILGFSLHNHYYAENKCLKTFQIPTKILNDFSIAMNMENYGIGQIIDVMFREMYFGHYGVDVKKLFQDNRNILRTRHPLRQLVTNKFSLISELQEIPPHMK